MQEVADGRAVGAGSGVNTSQSPPIHVPLRYMLMGLICFGLFAVDLALQARPFALFDAGLPAIVGLTHLLTLGALLSFVMGAVYQLSTVAFLMPLASERVARWNFWLYAVGIAGLIPSMMAWWRWGLAVFGAVTVLAVAVYAALMVVSLARTHVRGPMHDFVLSAHIHLLLAITAAALLLLIDGGALPSLSAWFAPLLATHILLAAGGYFLFLILGFSYKLLPMFTLSHGFATGGQVWALRLAHASLWLLMVAAWSGVWFLWVLGGVAAAALAGVQGWNIAQIIKKRMRKKVEAPIQGVLAAAVTYGLWALLLLLQTVWPPAGTGWKPVVQLELMGVVALTVMGFAYKIVPFLVWTQRYSKPRPGAKRVLIADLIQVERARPVLAAFVLGAWGMAAAAWAQSPVVAWFGTALIWLALWVFCGQMLRVMDLRKTVKEWTGRD
ncbi:MAG: hypothetical protein IRZ10_07370 [Thermoflavifilum sp.]|nr:hypothetical protein [Thermoflavifilum sp.]MCL6514228.1 hypothetical protein [Alicyclobacillus sp.]